jgi:hypothetical protein
MNWKEMVVTSAVGAVFSIVTYLGTKWVDKIDYINATGTVTELNGKWRGKITQRVKGNIEELPIEFIFKTDGKTINGDSTLNYRNTLIQLAVEGHSPVDRHMLLNYKNKDSIKMQFGAIAARVDASGLTFKGKFVGYGHINDSLVEGDIQLEKQP